MEIRTIEDLLGVLARECQRHALQLRDDEKHSALMLDLSQRLEDMQEELRGSLAEAGGSAGGD